MSLAFDRDGVEIIDAAVASDSIARLAADFDETGIRVGARPFSLSGTVRELISPDGRLTLLARRLVERNVRPVRVLAFNKTPKSNWHLPWHQDRVIAVRHRVDVQGFGNWTLKNGQIHAEAPLEILQTLFSVRLHLDHNESDNGALKIIPGSHRLGRLAAKEVRDIAGHSTHHVCAVRAGGVVAMKALTIHASDASRSNRPRRVLHVDYAWGELPKDLEWALQLPMAQPRPKISYRD